MAEILGLGGVSIDLLGMVSRMPQWNEVEYISQHQKQQGGMVATAMAAVAKLGGDAEFIGGVGDDEMGQFALHAFQQHGIHTARVKVFPAESTAFTFIAIDDQSGEKAFYHYKGVQGRNDLGLEDLDLDGVKYLHLDGFWFDTALQVARQAKERGILITLDISPNNRNPRLAELLSLADYIIPSYIFARRFSGETEPFSAAEAFLQFGPEAVVLTNGEAGCYLVSSQMREHVPAFQVPVVDTTGAGDTFHGAFIMGLNCGYDLVTAATFASAVAALKCTKIGGQAGLPTMQDVQDFLRAQE